MIALVLLTVFAGGMIPSVYLDGLVQSVLSPEVGRFLGLLLFGLIGLVFSNFYLIDKRRSIHRLRHKFQHSQYGWGKLRIPRTTQSRDGRSPSDLR